MRAIILLLTLFLSIPCHAYIRDDELESSIAEITHPIIEVAGLSPKHTNIYVINNNQVNAFVFGADGVYLHSGLLKYSADPELLAGIMAHECAHVAEGHASLAIDRYKRIMTRGVVLSTAFGLLGAVLNPGLGFGLAYSAGIFSMGQFTKFSRLHEHAADRIGVKYLRQLGLSGNQLIQAMHDFEHQERIYGADFNHYFATHPLSKDRIKFLSGEGHTPSNKPSYITAAMRHRYSMAIAKLRAFTEPKEIIARDYTDSSLPSRYARAISLYQQGKLVEALERAEHLIEVESNNPYFYEFKGDILFAQGKFNEALSAYDKALAIKPRSLLMRIEYAFICMQIKDKQELAIPILLNAFEHEPFNYHVNQLLVQAFAMAGEQSLSHLMLARLYLAAGNRSNAKLYFDKYNEEQVPQQHKAFASYIHQSIAKQLE
jgi:predicted Zn-dependent protease